MIKSFRLHFLVLASLLFFFSTANAQLTGTKSIPGDYPNISAAFQALNTSGVGTGGVTFNVAAGQVFIDTVVELTATGTLANPIVFKKNGIGSNPVIIPAAAGTVASSTSGGSHGDGIIIINGGDYITFDGIDVKDTVFTTAAAYDYGYYLKKASGTDACKNVTIKNCTITLNSAPPANLIYSSGIFVSNISGTGSATVTSIGGRVENVKILNNTINRAYAPIQLRGFPAGSPYDFYDQNIELDGNIITAYGGGATTAWGLYTAYQNNLKVTNNTFTGAVSHTTTNYSVYLNTGGAFELTGNKATINSSTTTSGTYGFYNLMGSAPAADINISNNIVENSTHVGATTATIYYIYNGAASTNLIMNGNIVRNNTRAATTGVTYAIYNSGSVITNFTMANNQVYKNTHTGSGVYYGLANNPASTTISKIYNNTVDSINHAGTGTINGIYALGSSTLEIYNNTVSALYGTAATINGMNLTSSVSGFIGKVYKNRIYNLSGSAAGSIVSGIYFIGGANFYAYNNYISDLKAPAASGLNAVMGFNVSGGTNIGLYYNTVFLNAVSSAATFGTSGVSASSTVNLEMKNNIIVNMSTAAGTNGYTAAYRRGSTTLSSYLTTSTANSFYAGTPGAANVILWDGTNAYQTMAAYKTAVSPRDAGSFSENPNFVNSTTAPYDLHINPAVPTQLEANGLAISTPVAITDDFDGGLRSATTPDIGADEFTGTTIDLTAPNIVYTLLSHTSSGSNRTLSSAITDPAGVNTTAGLKPRIYYKKLTDANTYAGNTSTDNGWKWMEASGTTSPFQFTIDYSKLQAPLATGDTLQYFVVAQDLISTPNVGINAGTFAAAPASVNLTAAAFPVTGSINFFVRIASITGTFNVGTGQTYLTLTAAVNDLNAKEMTGPVTFLLTDTLYNAETLPIVINENPGASALRLITVKPAPAVNAVISGTSTTSVIKLNGADYVVIDGSNTVGGTSKNLTINNTATTGTVAGIWVASLGTGLGANNVTVKNCKIINGHTGATSYAVYAGGNTLSASGESNDNLTIMNNIIEKSNTAIAVRGSLSGVYQNAVIKGNTIGSDNSANYNGKIGIDASQLNNALISENLIYNFIGTATNPTGINIGTGVVNSIVSRNNIHDLKYTGTSGYGGKGIDINTGNAASNLTISNNIMYNLLGDGYSTFSSDAIVGIRILGATGGLNILNNTVNLAGSITRSSATIDKSAALYVVSTATNLVVRNNILANKLENTTGISKSYSIFSDAPAFTYNMIDNNDYYVGGAEAMLAYFGADQDSLFKLRIATGKDLGSINGDPAFAVDTLLPVSDITNPNCWNVNGIGYPLASVAVDYYGNPRSTLLNTGASDIGAVEFTTTTTPPNAIQIGAPVLSGTSLYNVAGRTVVSIKWNSGTVPTTLDVKYYSGKNPLGGLANSRKSNAYYQVGETATMGTTYDITINYDESVLGTISRESKIRLAILGAGDWITFQSAGTGNGQYVLDTVANTIKVHGLSLFSQFALTDADFPLPVELASFTADSKGREVVLTWKTSFESNVKDFTVQRQLSSDKIWNDAAVINANNKASEYSYTDKKLSAGKYNYRLKVTDFDGSVNYSAVVESEVGTPNTFDLSQNYPNPFNPSTRIDYQVPVNASVKLELYSVTGEKIADLVNSELNAGYYTYDLTSSSIQKNLASGVYIYRMAAVDKVKGTNFVNVKKMLMLK